MKSSLSELLNKLTPEEKTEVETFDAFIFTRRKIQKRKLLTDDISVKELLQLVEDSGSFEWLNKGEEDVYSVDDGEEVTWESVS